jgi:hypothetical protein
MDYSASRAPVQHPAWEIWCFAGETPSQPTGLRMPVPEAGSFANEGDAVRQSHRVSNFLHETPAHARFDAAAMLAGADGVGVEDTLALLELPDFLRRLGVDPKRVFVTATPVPNHKGDGDNWTAHNPPWEAGEWVGGPDDAPADDDDSDDDADQDDDATALEGAVTVFSRGDLEDLL